MGNSHYLAVIFSNTMIEFSKNRWYSWFKLINPVEQEKGSTDQNERVCFVWSIIPNPVFTQALQVTCCFPTTLSLPYIIVASILLRLYNVEYYLNLDLSWHIQLLLL